MSTVARPRATIGTSKKNVPQFLARAKTIYNAMQANAAVFTSPTVPLDTFFTLIQALDVAEQNALTKAKGLTGIRDAKRDALWTAIESQRAYVQSLADGVAPANAIVVIESAGMVVRASTAHEKAILDAQLVPGAPGVVHLVANATLLIGGSGAKVQFNWQMSVDNGRTWTNLPSTPLASTDVAGLTLLNTYAFRVCVTLGRVVGESTQPVSVMVH